ncbi:MAG: fibronectin type III domain-containing protein, partial [Duncaniella sp.]|nr:fibronectin type III domain-containing protein [Duncaniella sp.]
IYKGILKYLHQVSGTPYVVAPLPVKSMKISGEKGNYVLSWLPTPDPLEPTARADYYQVYERTGDGAFIELAVVDEPRISLTPADDRIYSYKVVAVNRGGRSFPSETLALCNMPQSEMPQVTVVNGFTRVSGPAFLGEEYRRGADYETDFGVPYMYDLHFTGRQTEFAPGMEWVNNDDPGYGASDKDFERRLVAGNTFDYVYVHGEAIREAGAGFISESAEAFVNSTEIPAVVDLILGLQRQVMTGSTSKTDFKAFDERMQHRLSNIAAMGGNILVSGSYIASDLFNNPFSSPEVAHNAALFAGKVLGMTWDEGKVDGEDEAHSVKSKFNEFDGIGRLKFSSGLNEESYAVTSPDRLQADEAYGQPVMRYNDRYASVAGTAFDPGNHRTVCLGFPLESVKSSSKRADIMKSALAFFNAPKGRHHVRPKVLPETIQQPVKPKKSKKGRKK